MELGSFLNIVASASPATILAVVLYFCNKERVKTHERNAALLREVLDALNQSSESQRLLGEAIGRRK